jgi:putative colanic acid biosynthesis acetyltransferase WcaF
MGVDGLAVAEGGGIPEEPVIILPHPAPVAPPQPPAVSAVSAPVIRSVAAAPAVKSPAAAHSRRTANIPPWKPMEYIKRALWMIVRASLFRLSFHNWYGWRRFLLRLFGARIASGVRVRPTAMVEIPWTLDIGENAVIGDYAIIYSLGKITIGRAATISQYAHLCAGTHDYTKRRFPLLKPPIVIGEEAWIAADAFIGPGVTVGDRAVVGARATVFKNVAPDQVVVGPDATILKRRILED